MDFLKKYWRRIVLLVMILLLSILFDGYDHRHYLEVDINHFESVATIIFTVFGVVLIAALLIRGRKHIESVKHFFIAIFNMGFIILVWFFVFHNIATGIGLLINRQVSRGTVDKMIIAYRIDGKSVFPVWLSSPSGYLSLGDQENLRKYVKSIPTKPVDTLHIPLQKGLFGVAYMGDSK